MSNDACQQPTEGQRRAAGALIALGAGAGLDGRWCTRVRAEDVLVDSVVLIRVGDPAARAGAGAGSVGSRPSWTWRQRPVTNIWWAATSTSRNRASALTASLVVPPGHPKLSCARLRSTWLLSHLIAGTRLPELASAAGLRGITVLSDLLANVPPMDEQDSVQMLRGDIH